MYPRIDLRRLAEQVSLTHDIDFLTNQAYGFFRKQKVEPPSPGSLKRTIDSVIDTFEKKLYETTYEQISLETCHQIDTLLESHAKEEQETESREIMTFRNLLSSPRKPSVATMEMELQKLLAIRHLGIHKGLFDHLTPKLVTKYRLRAATETATELRTHPPATRYTILSVLFSHRQSEIIDGLADLLDEITHKFGNKAKNTTRKGTVEELEKVQGKNKHILNLLKATLDHPDGVIQDTLYPIESSSTIRDIIKDLGVVGNIKRRFILRCTPRIEAITERLFVRFKKTLHSVLIMNHINQLWKHWESFWSTVIVVNAILLLGTMFQLKVLFRQKWKDIIIEKDTRGIERVNKINYEIAVLQSLRTQLRCKEIWIEGASRYRNPDEDLPQDFEEHKEEYFQALKVPLDVEPFIANIKQTMKDKLNMLHEGIANRTNDKVAVTNRGNNGWIRVTPLDKQTDPSLLSMIKQEVRNRWSNIDLLDLAKETDFHTKFTNYFKTTADRSILDKETVQRRLLLCLFGLGTNTGLKAMSAGNHDDSYRELQYIRNKFIHKDHLRKANAEVTNHIIHHRLKEVWGEATTACASDSKHFGSYAQNLLTECILAINARVS